MSWTAAACDALVKQHEVSVHQPRPDQLHRTNPAEGMSSFVSVVLKSGFVIFAVAALQVSVFLFISSLCFARPVPSVPTAPGST